MHEKTTRRIKPNHWVPLKSLVPCHLVLPFSFHRFVVWTVVSFSFGSIGPRSRFWILLEVDQNQVRFHVSARCFRIQNAVLKNLDAWSISSWGSDGSIMGQRTYDKQFKSLSLNQSTGMLCDWSNLTSHTNLSCMPSKEFWGFSTQMVPPAQMTSNIRTTLLSEQKNFRGWTKWKRWLVISYFLIMIQKTIPNSKQKKFMINWSIRDRSLFARLTDGTFSSPSGTSRSLCPVPRLTGTNDEQQTAKTATRSLKEDLKIIFTARTKPALEFKSNGFLLPVFALTRFPYSRSYATARYPMRSDTWVILATPAKYSITWMSFLVTIAASSIQEMSKTRNMTT